MNTSIDCCADAVLRGLQFWLPARPRGGTVWRK